MNKTIFRQYDSRWGRLAYPGRGYTVASSGCGLVATTHCIIEMPKYKDWTPKTLRPYMLKYATYGNGTKWAGITATLEKFGYNVAEPNINKSMKDAWTYLNKKDALKRGVILFVYNKNTPVVYTKGGHYIMFQDYKYENGKHYFYLKDSGSRKHDGWKWGCYETCMKGAVKHIFICTGYKEEEKPIPKPKDKYGYTIPNPTLKSGSGGTRVKQLQRFLNWYCGTHITKLALDGEFGTKTENALMKFQFAEGISPDGIFGKVSYNKAIAYLPKKPDVKPDEKKELKIIDVSYWQHDINWKKASKEIDGAILRASYTGQKSFILSDDSTFATNVKGCVAQKVPIGAYHYSQAITVAEAKKEAEYLCRKLNSYKKNITLPVVMDWEFGGRLNSAKAKKLGKDKCTDIVCAFCNTVIDYGYTAMVYANYNTFSNYLDFTKLHRRYLIWLAQYSKKPSLRYDYWQYTSSGSVAGIKGRVDMNKAVVKK